MLQDDQLERLRSGVRVVQHLTSVARTAGLDHAAAATAGMSRRELVDAVLWMAAGGGASPQPEPAPALGPRLLGDEKLWTDDELRRAHADHESGQRDDRTRQGERIYQRLIGRRRRESAARLQKAS